MLLIFSKNSPGPSNFTRGRTLIFLHITQSRPSQSAGSASHDPDLDPAGDVTDTRFAERAHKHKHVGNNNKPQTATIKGTGTTVTTPPPFPSYGDKVKQTRPTPPWCKTTTISISNRFTVLDQNWGDGGASKLDTESRATPTPRNDTRSKSQNEIKNPNNKAPSTEEISFNLNNLVISTSVSNNARSVSLQENQNPKSTLLPETSASFWRQSRSQLQTHVRADTRRDFLEDLSTSHIITPWAAGLAQLPPYCLEDDNLRQDLIRIRKQQALEIQLRVSQYLDQKAKTAKTNSVRLLKGAEEYAEGRTEALQTAIRASATMVGRTKATLIKDLRERKEYLSQRQLTDQDWLNFYKLGAEPYHFSPEGEEEEGEWVETRDPPTQRSPLQNTHKPIKFNFTRHPVDPPNPDRAPHKSAPPSQGNPRKRKNEDNPRGYQGKTPHSTPNFQTTQPKGANQQQTWGGQGRAKAQKKGNHPPQSKGGPYGRRPKGQNPKGQNPKGQNPKGQNRRDRPQEGWDTTLTKKEWALVQAYRQ